MTRTTHAPTLSLCLLTLAVACQRPPSATPPPLPPRALEGPPIARTVWLAHDEVKAVVSFTLGYEIRLLGQTGMPVSELPFREVVMFAVDGATFCRHSLPRNQQRGCQPPAKADAYTDHYQFEGEILGFAVLTYTSAQDAAVEQIRVVPGDWPTGMLFAHADPDDLPYIPADLIVSHNTDHNVRTLEARDVDGDGEPEIVATVQLQEYEVVPPYPTIHFSHLGGRLLILRDNLTRQLDIPLDFYTNTEDDAPVPAGAAHSQNFSFAIEPAAVTAQWCELAARVYDTLSECAIELACAQPTARARWTYDPRTDAYLDGAREQLREPIDEADPTWTEQCPDDEDEDYVDEEDEGEEDWGDEGWEDEDWEDEDWEDED